MSAHRHRQAEPVALSTGETVACLCVECFTALPADWIENQRSAAERKARCEHGDWVSIRALGDVDDPQLCTRCGEMRIR